MKMFKVKKVERLLKVRKKIIEMVADDEAFSLDHESHAIFKAGHDEQLLLWLHRKPEVLPSCNV